MIWLLLLPFRLLFGVVFGLVALPFVLLFLPIALLIWLPFAILRFTLKVVFGLILLPVIAVVMLVGLLVGGMAVAAAVLIPLIPLLFGAFCVWVGWRLIASPAKTVMRT
jgi:hypothetical protein